MARGNNQSSGAENKDTENKDQNKDSGQETAVGKNELVELVAVSDIGYADVENDNRQMQAKPTQLFKVPKDQAKKLIKDGDAYKYEPYKKPDSAEAVEPKSE